MQRFLCRHCSSDPARAELSPELPHTLNGLRQGRDRTGPRPAASSTTAVFYRFLHLHSSPPKATYQPMIPLPKWWHLSVRKCIYYCMMQSTIKGQLVHVPLMFKPPWSSCCQLLTPYLKLGHLLSPGTALTMLPDMDPCLLLAAFRRPQLYTLGSQEISPMVVPWQ